MFLRLLGLIVWSLILSACGGSTTDEGEKSIVSSSRQISSISSNSISSASSVNSVSSRASSSSRASIVSSSSRSSSSSRRSSSSSSLTGLEPSISAAVVSGQEWTLTGVRFGEKTTAAPIKFEDFESRTAGALPEDIGYHNYTGFGGSTNVDGATGFSGSKSLKHQSGFAAVSSSIRESFPHIGVRGFSGTELYLSYRMKYKSNGSEIAQLKFNRSGMETGTDCYGGGLKFRSSYYLGSNGLLSAVQGGVVNASGTAIFEGWVGSETNVDGPATSIPEDTWVQVEDYYKMNDIGQSNGQYITFVNGNPHFNLTNLNVRNQSGQVFNCSYLVIGIDYYINSGATNGVSVWYDDHYLDTTRARVVLANSSDYSRATIRSPQPAVIWQENQITAQIKSAGLSSGQAWLFVVRADGSVSNAMSVTLP